MKPVIEPVPRELIRAELTPDRLLRHTNNAGNEIYVFTAAECPHAMREVGRLREWAFRSAGGGTGEEVDIDELDLAEGGYTQLIVWDPERSEIVGGYRYIVSRRGDTPFLSTEHYFRFSELFRRDYLPYLIELGRSFVHPDYQRVVLNRKGLYALDNLWDGLGALMVYNPHARYFFGKVTMYGHYNHEARNMLIYFLRKYFPDRDRLVEPIYPVELDIDYARMEQLFDGGDYHADYKILVREVRLRNENIPPMINSYMSLSPSMRVFGTVRNPDFGEVEETGILLTISDIYPAKAERHTRGLLALKQFLQRRRNLRRLRLRSVGEGSAAVRTVATTAGRAVRKAAAKVVSRGPEKGSEKNS